jgi:hypothetical protein
MVVLMGSAESAEAMMVTFRYIRGKESLESVLMCYVG